MEYSFDLSLPLKLSANLIYSGRHWSKRNSDAEVIHSDIFYQHKEKHIFDAIIGKLSFPIDMEYHFKWKGRNFDVSNVFYEIKLCEDSFKHIFLPDDNDRYVKSIKATSSGGHKDNSLKLIIHSC